MTDTLRDRLASVPGVASAEVRLGPDAAPVEVKVRLTPDADPDRVGAEVRRVLAASGMRSRLVARPEPESPPAETMAKVVPMTPLPSPDAGAARPTAESGIRSVAVEERPEGRRVVVTLDDGRMGSRRQIGPSDDLAAAVVAAVADALGLELEAATTQWSEFDGTAVVTVVARRAGGVVAAGASVTTVGTHFAVAAAARSALDRP